ncbi:hypothetical protein GUJ93_ZPchr0014g47675 [Zizania palustris]|uniref:Uncharacterized protein n=1 Tax=Zizania palustris TaxID=103762 RepID=A0A8J5W6V4_ZIZPA|nr:hypothetical protein GUJ93_ZPchr0014g47675 [Zizania palustris]
MHCGLARQLVAIHHVTRLMLPRRRRRVSRPGSRWSSPKWRLPAADCMRAAEERRVPAGRRT